MMSLLLVIFINS